MKKVCCFPECDRKAKVRGLCVGHINQTYRGADPMPLRVWKRIDIDEVVEAIHSGEAVGSIASRLGHQQPAISIAFKRVFGISIREYKGGREL